MFVVDQKVWCLFNGVGVINQIAGDRIIVDFNNPNPCNKNGIIGVYTTDGGHTFHGVPPLKCLFNSEPSIVLAEVEETKSGPIPIPGLCNITIDGERIHTVVEVVQVGVEEGVFFYHTNLSNGKFIPVGAQLRMDYVDGIDFETFKTKPIHDQIKTGGHYAIFKLKGDPKEYVVDYDEPLHYQDTPYINTYDPEARDYDRVPLITVDGELVEVEYVYETDYNFLIEDSHCRLTFHKGNYVIGLVHKETTDAVYLKTFDGGTHKFDRKNLSDVEEL